MLHDLDLSTLDLKQWSHTESHMMNTYTKFENLRPMCSRVVRHDVSHRLPLTMHLKPLHMCQIMWPVH